MNLPSSLQLINYTDKKLFNNILYNENQIGLLYKLVPGRVGLHSDYNLRRDRLPASRSDKRNPISGPNATRVATRLIIRRASDLWVQLHNAYIVYGASRRTATASRIVKQISKTHSVHFWIVVIFSWFQLWTEWILEICSPIMGVTVTGACADVHIQYRPYLDSQTFN